MHDGHAGGHFSGDTTAHNILKVGYYWPNLFKYAHAYVRKCHTCQRSGGRLAKATEPLQPVIISEPFEQWGIEIIREINPILHYNINISSQILITSQYGYK